MASLERVSVCVLALGLLFCGIASCNGSNFPPVGPISFVAVDVVDPEQIRDPGDALDYTLHTDDPVPMVRITFSSPDDFQNIAVNWRYFSIRNTIGFCDGASLDTGMLLDGLPDLYDASAMIDPHRPKEYGTSRKSSAGNVLYHVYFFPRRKLTNPKLQADRFHRKPYDLTVQAQDVCLQVGGGQEDGPLGFRTNVLYVPAAALRAAFTRAHLKCLSTGIHCERAPS